MKFRSNNSYHYFFLDYECYEKYKKVENMKKKNTTDAKKQLTEKIINVTYFLWLLIL